MSSRRREAPFTAFTPASGRPHTIRPVCTILLAWRCHPGRADRARGESRRADRPPERAARASSTTSPLIVGGRDLVAGGTWLAVGRRTARSARSPTAIPPTGPPVAPDPTRRSRGEIPVCAADRRSCRRPGRLAASRARAVYNPVNVLWLTADRALVAHVDDSGPVRVVELAPGPHVLTTRDVDDAHESQGRDAARGHGSRAGGW